MIRFCTSLRVTGEPYVTQNYGRNDGVMIPHPNIALEGLVLCSKQPCPPQQLRLAQGADHLVRDRVRWYPNFRRYRLVDKGIHRAVSQHGKHVRGFCIVGAYVAVREGVKSGEQ